MRIVIEGDEAAAALRAAQFIAELVRCKPAALLALPAGQTPERTYAELARMHREQSLSFAEIHVFNLDEWLGIPGDDPRSFAAQIRRSFLAGVDVRPERSHALDGTAADPAEECADYEERISELGGLDLAWLGIGADGHIGFNEPGSSLGSRTRLKTITAETVRANASGFGDEREVPRLALTMGVGTILSARRVLLLATGPSKADAVRAAVEGPVTAQVTASALQLHPDAIIVLDEAAARALERRSYYREVESLQRELERTRKDRTGKAPRVE